MNAHQPKTLRTFAVYHNPSDYPGRYVVRGFTITPGRSTPDEKPTAVVNTLDEARAAIPEDLHREPAVRGDDPVIVEVWL